MEQVEQSGGSEGSRVAEEASPPRETSSNSNGITSCPHKAAAEAETEPSEGQWPVSAHCGSQSRHREPPPPPAAPVAPPTLGPVVVVQGSSKNSASEKLQRVRKWSVTAFKCTKQALAEKLGRGSRTVDLDLEPRLDLLKDDRQRYDNVTKLAQTLANQIGQFSVTQKTLGDAFAELSVKTPSLHVEFGVNADAQRFVSKSGDVLVEAITSFISDMDTLVNKTIEDTMVNAKQYEASRIEYDAYRVDLEELNLKPRDDSSLPRLEQAQKVFQGQREQYLRIRDDLSVKVKLLEENRVKVLHNQLWLLHSAVAAHSLSCHRFLQQNLQQADESLRSPSVDPPSWLEQS